MIAASEKKAPAGTEAMGLSNTKNATQTAAGSQGIKCALYALDAQVMEQREQPGDYGDDVPFPAHFLPEKWQALAVQSAERAPMPVQMPAMTMLATVSASMGKAWIAKDGCNHDPDRGNLYIVTCAKSSTGKDVAAKLVDPFFSFEKDLQYQHTLSERADDTPKPLLSVGNATSEALAARMQNPQECMFSFSAEAGDMMRVASGIYKNGKGEFAFYNGTWSGSKTDFARMTRDDVTLSSPCLTLCWSVQPTYFNELTRSAGALHSGFIPRCLAYDAKAAYALDDGVERKVDLLLKNQWAELIHGILSKRMATDPADPQTVQCTPEARKIFREFHNRYQERMQKEGDIAALMGKARQNAIRIALVLAVMNGANEIDVAEAYGGCAIVDWCLESTLGMMQEARSEALESAADKLAGKLVDRYGGQASLRSLKRNNGIDTEHVEQLAKAFPERFGIENIQSGGRPSRVVRVLD